jgi:hypothetical protein
MGIGIGETGEMRRRTSGWGGICFNVLFKVVNWRNVEERFANARKSVTVHQAAVQAENEAKAKAEEEKKKVEEAAAAAEKEKDKQQ